jgi:hypothetical protein
MKFYAIFSDKLAPYAGKNIKTASIDLEATDQRLIILWNVDNDRKIRHYATVVAKQWLCKQRPLLGSGSVD